VIVQALGAAVLSLALLGLPAGCEDGGTGGQESSSVVVSKYKTRSGRYYVHLSDGRNVPVDSATYRDCDGGEIYHNWWGCSNQMEW